MTLHTWISVQSDYGITLGELGSLSSDTDSKLIASTLMALKDIVSVEASSGESQFMTGSVETSSFGTFAITIGEELKLVMSYILSVDSGDTVSNEIVNLVQRICTYFGKQLTQLGNIATFVKSGRTLTRALILQAYLNAVTLVKLEKNVDSNEKAIKRDTEDTIERLFSDNERLTKTIFEAFPEKWLQENDRWYNGFLKTNSQDELLDAFSLMIIYLLVNKDPLSMLNSNNPKNEFKEVKVKLSNKLESISDNSQKPLIKSLEKEIKSGLDEFVKTIALNQLHTANTIIFNEFVRRAYISVAKSKPWILFKSPKKSVVRKEFNKHVRGLKITNTGSILENILSKKVKPRTRPFISEFFEGFLEGMVGIPMEKPAVSLLMSFTGQFIEVQELISLINQQTNMEANWKANLVKIIEANTEDSIEVTTIEEAVNVSSAGINAILRVISKVITNYFIDTAKKDHNLVVNISNYFLETGPKIKASLILLSILQIISKCSYPVNFMTPSYKDLIGTAMMDKGYRLKVEDNEIKIGNNLFTNKTVKVGDQKYKLIKFYDDLQKFSIVITKEEEMEIDLKKLNFEAFLKLVDTPEIIINSIRNVGYRRSEVNLINFIDEYARQLFSPLNQLIDKIERGKATKKEINEFNPKIFLIDSKKVQFPGSIQDIIQNYGEILRKSYASRFQNQFDVFKNKATIKGANPQKEVKKLTKFVNNMDTELDSIKENARKELFTLANKAMKEFGQYKKEIKERFQSSQPEILRYQYKSKNLLQPVGETSKQIESYISSKYSNLFHDSSTIKFNAALSIFRNPPDVIFDPIYSNIIQNEIEDEIAIILKESNSKFEFELNLSEGSKLQSKLMVDALEDILWKALTIYIHFNGIVSTEPDLIKLHLERIPLKRYPQRKFLEELLGLQNLTLDRETDSWLISYSFTKNHKTEDKIPNIITFSDTISYLHRTKFREELKELFLALSNVANLIERGGGNSIFKFFEILQNAIFHID